jgi:tRNA pseudouridine32 synthase/23S rRNA pseudouridine746 synthase
MIPEVLFENADVIAVSKPEGLASIPERFRGRESLLSLLSSRTLEKLYVVHRLDKEASGVILFAKHEAAHRFLNRQFERGRVKKTYLALTHGVIEAEKGVIDRAVRAFGSGRMGVDAEKGKRSITGFVVRRRFDAYTLVNVFPATGRRHQIRVHFYSINHPLVGDLRYGDRELQRPFPRLMLHAEEITVLLPSNEEVRIIAPVPDSFQKVLDELQGEGKGEEAGVKHGRG